MAENKDIYKLLKTIVVLLISMLALQGIMIWRSFILEEMVTRLIPWQKATLGLETNQPAPDFRLSLLGEKREVSLETFKSRPFLLVFSDASCPHCQQMHPELLAFHRAHPDFTILMILRGSPSPDLQNSGILIAPWKDKVVRAYRVPGTPWFYFIDKNGIIKASFSTTDRDYIEHVVSTFTKN